ncbi:MAG: putative baseplate assembly protein, partial [Anaerolineae bacterium]
EEAQCEGEGLADDPLLFPGRYRPRLEMGPLTFSQRLPKKSTPASSLLAQDPRQALPWLRLAGRLDATCRAEEPPPPSPEPDPEKMPPEGGPPEGEAYGKEERPEQQAGRTKASQAGEPAGGSRVVAKALPEETARREPWWPVRDLLASGPRDRHFVAEVDDEGRARLRFGDGELGQQPAAHTRFRTTYRVGIGPAGNVGAEAISHAVARNGLTGAGLKPRNPLPARGGIDPESIEEVKLFAPHAFRRELQRAITADDYAALVMRDFGEKVQRAAAVLRWMGSWYEVLVAVDRRQAFAGDEALLAEIEARLQRYRRMGHDLAVAPAVEVALDLEIDVCVEAHYLRGHVKAALRDLFSNRLLPDGRRGFFHPDNLTFGQGIYVSELVARAQAVPGVESATVTRLERLYEGANDELQEGILPLSPLEVARLDNDPSFPENGRLKLTMRGGR